MPRQRVASIRLNRGMFWAELIFESHGGANDLWMKGLPKGTAQKVRRRLEESIDQMAEPAAARE